MSESAPLLPESSTTSHPVRKPGHSQRPGHVSLWRVGIMFILLVLVLSLIDIEMPEIRWPGDSHNQNLCPQVDALYPSGAANVIRMLDSQKFETRAIEALSGAVKIATETFDDMGPIGKDPAWDVFDTFQEYLKTSFPLVSVYELSYRAVSHMFVRHKHLTLIKVNTYGLVYHWTGSDTSLKPILLAAHQDTVPVNPTTVDQWTYPPWSGHYDGEFIWGRGSTDDKAGLISILLSIETLLSSRFRPHRTVILAFGFDEEISGIQGAAKLGPYLEQTYGRDGFALLVDEGAGISEQFGAAFAAPGIAEKGYLDLRIEVATPGGHSSIPPENHHTGIGILSHIIGTLENNTITPRINRSQPMYRTFQCLAEHAPEMPSLLKRAISRSHDSNRDLRRMEEMVFKDNVVRSTVATTQAVTMIHGGVKSNALPELSWAIANHRIATDSSLSALQSHLNVLLRELATVSNITFVSFGKTLYDRGETLPKITISDAWGTALEPAPVSPTDSEAFRLLSGTILATELRGRNASEVEPVYVVPSIMSGNTDTRHYWNLTKHIYRYDHLRMTDTANIHTVDERIRATGFIGMVRFFTNLILNADQSRSL
ncbi:hypothetical protein FRC17_010040 [Serendipita sp. 399]|nr:hypothetical protein FRC17_010040 [Serendipita sp. 399]